MGVTAIRPGVFTTVQDLGRFGYLGSGFSPSGVMDKRAMRTANLLVDNDENAPVLEFCLGGPTLRFTTTTVIATTGADFAATLDGAPLPRNQAVVVKRGQVVSFTAPMKGVYGYLAVAGGSFAIEPVMGSASTNLKCHLGGWQGRRLETGDYLPFSVRAIDYLENLDSHVLQDADDFYEFDNPEITLRVVPGPQENLFTPAGIDTFYGQAFSVTSKCDRMGYRLDGPEVETDHGSDIISDGIAFGAVQIPKQGRPIIMLVDRQTTGGYAKIGTVASVDIPKLVQSPAGRRIRFTPVSVQEAQSLYREEELHMKAMQKMVRRPSYGGISPRKTARRLTPILEEQAKKAKTESEALWVQSDTHLHADRNPDIVRRRQQAAQLAQQQQQQQQQ